MWCYDPVAGQWAWLSGDKAPNGLAKYGTKGKPGAGNVPGARFGHSSAYDSKNDRLYIFSGYGNTDTMTSKPSFYCSRAG